MSPENYKWALDFPYQHQKIDCHSCDIRWQRTFQNTEPLQSHLWYVVCFDCVPIRKHFSPDGIVRHRMDICMQIIRIHRELWVWLLSLGEMHYFIAMITVCVQPTKRNQVPSSRYYTINLSSLYPIQNRLNSIWEKRRILMSLTLC